MSTPIIRVQPSRPFCSHGHPRTEENTRWFIHSNGKEYAACRACADERVRPSKALPVEERARRRTAKAAEHIAWVLTRYTIDETTGCWLWTGGLDSWGYGHAPGGMAHRFFYKHLVGPIPEGLQLDHTCCVKICVNPAHLEPVTPAENTRRSHARLTLTDISEIRRLHNEGAYGNELARQYGVSTTHIRRIVRGQAWRDT